MKLKAGLWAGGVLAVAAVSAAIFFAVPYECISAYRQARLRLSGAAFVRLDGGLVAYEKNTCRPGRPCRCVALIHGLGDSALTWDRLLLDPRASVEGLRIVAPNMPGADGSPSPADPSGWAIPAQARTLRTALEGRCPSWTVAGNSLGGWTSMRLALDWPSGVRDLVLLDPAGLSDPSGRSEESLRVLADPNVELLKAFSKRARFVDRDGPERAWRSALAAIVGRHTHDIMRGLRREDLLDSRLGSLRAPTTIIWGDADGIIPPALGPRFHRLIAGSRLEPIQRCGHLPQQECPEPVARAVFGAPAAN